MGNQPGNGQTLKKLTACPKVRLPEREDAFVGYFMLRSWLQVDALIKHWAGPDGHTVHRVLSHNDYHPNFGANYTLANPPVMLGAQL